MQAVLGEIVVGQLRRDGTVERGDDLADHGTTSLPGGFRPATVAKLGRIVIVKLDVSLPLPALGEQGCR